MHARWIPLGDPKGEGKFSLHLAKYTLIHTHATATPRPHSDHRNPQVKAGLTPRLTACTPSTGPRAVTHTVISRLPTVEVKSLGVHEPRLVPRIDLVEPHSQGAKPGLRSDA